jgi:hypothetical protein
MTERLAIGTGAASGADFTITADTTVLFHLKNAAGPSVGAGAAPCYLEIKSGAVYFSQQILTPNNPGCRVTGGAVDTTWRWRRAPGGSDPVGVEQQ